MLTDPKIRQKWKEKNANRPLEFDYARDRDHILTPFQCDLCVFRRILSRDPVKYITKDETALIHIR